jgi:hypothetical protein
MLKALIRRKASLRDHRSEDVLTSSVLGSMSYLHPRAALVPFLARAVGDARAELRALLEDIAPSTLAYEFWPSWKTPEGSWLEPDVVITWSTVGGRDVTALVEAKYRSGKSKRMLQSDRDEPDTVSWASSDQLADEWRALRHAGVGRELFLLYVTAHLARPTTDLTISIRECGDPEARMLWLSWREAGAVLASASGAVEADICAVLEQSGLTWFDGVTSPSSATAPWEFRSTPRLARWTWPTSPCPFKWR